jgi:hypothetical protein
MKKNSKKIGKDYSKLDQFNCVGDVEYYGVLLRDGRTKIDTKRYKKFFKIPDSKIEIRKAVYYLPTKIHRNDYLCNWFRDELQSLKQLWNTEFRFAIEAIKSPKDVIDNYKISHITQGDMDYEDAIANSIVAGVKRIKPYKKVIKALYAQFFHQMMANIDAVCLRVISHMGYQEDDYTKKQFDTYIQGRQGENAKSFRQYQGYFIYDRANLVWNFLKHNSLKSYSILKRYYPEMIWDPNNEYKNGDLAISVLKLDEKFILHCLDNLHIFFDELCERGFYENPLDAQWDYDDYFLSNVKEKIKQETDYFDE